MRSITRFAVIAIAFSFLSVGCATTSGGNSSGGDMEFLTPEVLIENPIIGTSDGEGSFDSLVLHSDQTLEITVDGTVSSGTWEYDPNATLMAYTLNWNQDGEEQGYLTSLALKGEAILIMGHWYITDMNKQWYASGKFNN